MIVEDLKMDWRWQESGFNVLIVVFQQNAIT